MKTLPLRKRYAMRAVKMCTLFSYLSGFVVRCGCRSWRHHHRHTCRYYDNQNWPPGGQRYSTHHCAAAAAAASKQKQQHDVSYYGYQTKTKLQSYVIL